VVAARSSIVGRAAAVAMMNAREKSCFRPSILIQDVSNFEYEGVRQELIEANQVND